MSQANTQRAVIDWAMGIMMLRYGLSADSAFQMLTKLSQQSNIKLRNIAERVVAEITSVDTLPDDAADRVDPLLRAAWHGSA
jgi:hypothetical protein